MNDDLELDPAAESQKGRPEAPGLDRLLEYLHESRRFDFEGYKRVGLERRLLKRVQVVGLSTFDEYVAFLDAHPGELDYLFSSTLINTTRFFRDPDSWELLARDVIPLIIAAKRDAPDIRVWSAGCASGQEAYSVATLFADALGVDVFARKVKVYATDMDGDALASARRATYSPKELAGVSAAQLSKYFDQVGSSSTVRAEIRSNVIFGRHNLLSDAPLPRIDLLLCRNTLMYFHAEAQARILASIHVALADTGVLFLGRPEMLLTHAALFAPLDRKHRLFTKVKPTLSRTRVAFAPPLTRPDDLALSVVTLLEVTSTRRVQRDLEQATQELEDVYEELRATSEQLETTNEELQSTVEELETTNEALQSTNDELETTNDELHSTNEALLGANAALRVRTDDLSRVNIHYQSILASLRSAVVVLDADMLVQVWSSRAAKLWASVSRKL